jgi:hypothetical protein
MFGAYMLRIDSPHSSLCIVPWINMMWPSLLPLSNFILKSILSDIRLGTPACSWDIFAWKNFFYPLTLKQLFIFFSVRCVSCKQNMVGSCFLTQFVILCLLIGVLRPLTFGVGIDMCVIFLVTFIPFNLYLFLVYWCAWSKEFILSCIFLSCSTFFLVRIL